MQNIGDSGTPIPSIVIPKNFNIMQQIGVLSTKVQSIISKPNPLIIHKQMSIHNNQGIYNNL